MHAPASSVDARARARAAKRRHRASCTDHGNPFASDQAAQLGRHICARGILLEIRHDQRKSTSKGAGSRKDRRSWLAVPARPVHAGDLTAHIGGYAGSSHHSAVGTLLESSTYVVLYSQVSLLAGACTADVDRR